MAKRFFRTFSLAELLAELRITEQGILNTVSSGSGGDSSATQKRRQDLDRNKRQIEHDLFILDPTTYPRTDINRINRTTPEFK